VIMERKRVEGGWTARDNELHPNRWSTTR
jgi:hypothetical protein